MPYYAETLVFLAGSICLAALYAASNRPPALQRGLEAGAVLGVALMALFYFESWVGQHPARWLHLHDFYHYYVGAKYYREVGHMRLYTCTHAAFRELRQEGLEVPAVTFVRALERPSEIISGEALVSRGAQCRESFDPARWQEFKTDLAVLLAHDARDGPWRSILTDLGNNSPPGWNVAASFLANRVPLSGPALIALPMLDQVLLLVVLPLAVYRVFGFVPMLAYLLFYFANPLANLGWNGGSYFRADWYAALAGGLIALAARRFALAGFLLAVAVVCRAFPVVFAFGALLALALAKADRRSGLVRLCAGGAAGVLAFGALSLFMFGPGVFYEFADVLRVRINPYGNNSIGLLKVASFWNVLVWPSFEGAADALNAMDAWLAAVRHDALAHRPLTRVLQLMLLGAAVLAVRERDPMAATVVFGAAAVFTMFSPFIYYFVFLALLPLAAWRLGRGARAYFMLAAALGMVALRIASIPFQREIGFDPGYFSVSLQSSRVLLVMLACLIAVTAWYAGAANARAARWNGVAAALALVVLAVAAVTYRARPSDQTHFHVLDGLGAASAAAGVAVEPRPATASWPGHRYYEIEFTGAQQWLRVPLDDIAPGRYRVRLAATASDRYVNFFTAIDARRYAIEHEPVPHGSVSPVVSALGEVSIGAGSVVRFEPATTNALQAPIRIGVGGLFFDPVAAGEGE